MTKTGYDFIIDRIINHPVVPPDKSTIEELRFWLHGYTKCQLDILAILEELKKDQKD